MKNPFGKLEKGYQYITFSLKFQLPTGTWTQSGHIKHICIGHKLDTKPKTNWCIMEYPKGKKLMYNTE